MTTPRPKPAPKSEQHIRWTKSNRKRVRKALALGLCPCCRRRRPRATYVTCDHCRRYQKAAYHNRVSPDSAKLRLEKAVLKAAMDCLGCVPTCCQARGCSRCHALRVAIVALDNYRRENRRMK